MTRLCILVMILSVLTACQSRRSEWDSIDYTRVYEQNRARENDSVYRQPNVISCVDDDLYNCSR